MECFHITSSCFWCTSVRVLAARFSELADLPGWPTIALAQWVDEEGGFVELLDQHAVDGPSRTLSRQSHALGFAESPELRGSNRVRTLPG